METDSNPSGKDSDFRDFLREVLTGHKSVNELLMCPPFTRRLRGHCRALARNDADADELYNDVCYKVSQALPARFELDSSKEFGGFFGWLRRITVRSHIDRIRPRKLAIDSEPVENRVVVDLQADVERKAEHKERLERLVKCIMSQPEEVRLVAELYVLRGLSSEETAKELAELGIHITAPTVRNRVRAALTPFFPHAIAFSDTELARLESQQIKNQSASETSKNEPARKGNKRAKGQSSLQAQQKDLKAQEKQVARKKDVKAKRRSAKSHKKAAKAKRKSASGKT